MRVKLGNLLAYLCIRSKQGFQCLRGVNKLESASIEVEQRNPSKKKMFNSPFQAKMGKRFFILFLFSAFLVKVGSSFNKISRSAATFRETCPISFRNLVLEEPDLVPDCWLSYFDLKRLIKYLS